MRREWRRVAAPARRAAKRFKTRRKARKGVELAPNWPRSRLRVTLVKVASYIGALLLFLWVVRSFGVAALAGEPWSFPFDPDEGCEDTGYSCGVLSGIAMTILSLALASGVFLFWRLRAVRLPYLARAERDARDLVPTAGRILDDVVGRDELCNVIMDDLRDRGSRRPHVLVGGVGTGKTAVIVNLTALLAAHGAVPVPIRLRDAATTLDFRELARERFIGQTNEGLVSSGEGEKIWRHLCKEDQVVVLADGLEEALTGDEADKERDNLIRLAIAQAEREQLPLVIASRPHGPLSSMHAAIVELEPLSEQAAFNYIAAGSRVNRGTRLDWLVETANVVEAPLYLKIARDLRNHGLLERATGRDVDKLDTRGVDRVVLRMRLMDTWKRALVNGYLPADVPLSPTQRGATVEQLSALACIGLKQDSLEVKFEDLTGAPASGLDPSSGSGSDAPGGSKKGAAKPPPKPPHQALVTEVEKRLQQLDGGAGKKRRPATEAAAPDEQPEHWSGSQRWTSRVDIRLAATRGQQLDLVESRGGGVRFPHSILQAYLGSSFLGAVLGEAGGDENAEFADESFLREALANPGRELLVALVLHCHARLEADQGKRRPWRRLCRELCEYAVDGRPSPDAKSLYLLGAALEIDSISLEPSQKEIATKVIDIWDQVADEPRTIEEAKIDAIGRFGESARKVADRSAGGDRDAGVPAYSKLYELARIDASYPIRLAVAHELGSGGNAAFDALNQIGGDERANAGKTRERTLTGLDVGVGTKWREDSGHRALTMDAWLAPLLVSSTSDDDQVADHARAVLDAWLERVKPTDPGKARLPISLEVALAQGFKHAANRRPEHPQLRPEAREYLMEKSHDMLKAARFWFSRLTLVQALCLWTLPDTRAYRSQVDATTRQYERPLERIAKARRKQGNEARLHGRDPNALVAHWMQLPAGEDEHPFVAEARDLAVLALDTAEPERFIWIDESGVVAKVGSRASDASGVRRKHHLWIPPSTGWSALHPRAQQLVADVLLLLNLAERGDNPVDREQRLSRTVRNDLPPCLAAEREEYLDPRRTVGAIKRSPPGSNCKDGCPFDLCPYPPKGEATYREELSEAFCRRQQTLLGRRPASLSRGAPWQGVLAKELRNFWIAMEKRAQR